MSGFRRAVARAVDRLSDRVLQRIDTMRGTESGTLAWIASGESLEGLEFPRQYLDFLQGWVRPLRWDVSVLKAAPTGSPFAELLDALANRVPVPPLSLGREAGRAADSVRQRFDRMDGVNWHGDVGMHFEMSSSFSEKGRLLYSATRYMRPKSALELGTAYGMSGFFIARTQQLVGGGRLVTVELGRQQHGIASQFLQSAGLPVECRHQLSQDALGELRAAGAQFDFVFHDAGHTFDAYVKDFDAMEPMLGPGAVLILDDIRWADARFHDGDPRTYQGWRQVAAHPRVAAAAEINRGIGIALLR